MAARIIGSPDIYGDATHDINQSIHFVSCHDGFTLNDLVTYRIKHNLANGEDNRDGLNENFSANYGVEGPSDDPAVEALRERQVRNFFALLLFTHGTPMIGMGDEVRRTQRAGMTPEKAAAMLRSALELANSAVFEQSQLSDDFTGMGTTLVAVWISRDLAVVINVGDSRAYHFTREDVRLITRDHSMVAYMVERGELTQEQAKLHPGKNVITRAVGTEPEVEGDVFTCRLRRDECILLCSDGLSNEMADQEMLFEVVHGLSKSDCCQRLLHIAKNRGAPDNVTVTLAAV